MWRCAGHPPVWRHKGMKGDHLVVERGFFTVRLSVFQHACRQSSLVCVHRYVCVSMCGEHPWQMRKRRLQDPLGTNFPSLFWGPVHYCEQEGTILHSRPTSFAAIYSYSLSLSLSSWNTTLCHPDFPQCTTAPPVKPRLVAVGSPRFQSCRRRLECFLSLPSIFPSVMFWEWKYTRHLGFSFFFFFPRCCMWGSDSFKLALKRRGESERDKRQKQRCRLQLKDANTPGWEQMELELNIQSWICLLKFVCLVLVLMHKYLHTQHGISFEDTKQKINDKLK